MNSSLRSRRSLQPELIQCKAFIRPSKARIIHTRSVIFAERQRGYSVLSNPLLRSASSCGERPFCEP